MPISNSDPSKHGFIEGSLLFGCDITVRREIIDAIYRIGDPNSYLQFWTRVLTQDEREKLGDNMDLAFVNSDSAIGQLATLRNWPRERAIIEISYQLGGMLPQDYLRLLRTLGYDSPDVLRSTLDIPKWEQETGQLSFRGRLCRKVSSRATAIRPVLEAFQKAGWPNSLPDVARDSVNPNRVDDLVTSLNTNLLHIKFSRSGESIRWYPTPS